MNALNAFGFMYHFKKNFIVNLKKNLNKKKIFTGTKNPILSTIKLSYSDKT